MKMDRLIGIITILMRRDKVTAPELAERFEVSRRTINRDIENLCKAGIPLVTTQGYGGGISVADGYKIDKSLFTGEELQAVAAALKGLDSVSKTSYLKTLTDKLFDAKSSIAADDIILIDLASHYQHSLTEKIDVVKKAILNRQLISFQYYSEKGEGRRMIEPYRLVFKWSSWYVFGYCLDRCEYRLFKLNRLWNPQIQSERFRARAIPKERLSFDDYFRTCGIHLKAVFSNSEKRRLIEEYGIGCYTRDENGGLIFEWDFVSYEHMRKWIFSFGDKVTVLEPESLIEDRRRQAENILKNKHSKVT